MIYSSNTRILNECSNSRICFLIRAFATLFVLCFGFSVYAQQSGLDIAVFKDEAGKGDLITMFQKAGKSQVSGNNCQNYGNDSQINVRFHSLLPPRVNKNKINENCDDTANYRCEKISVRNIPFNHDLTSLANSNENRKKTKVMTSDNMKDNEKSKILCGWMIKGEITPTVNQATAMLPQISEDLFSWAKPNFITVKNDNTRTQGMSTARRG